MEEDKTFVLTPYFRKEYPVISHGKGIYMYTEDGKKIIDGTSGAVLVSLGHGRKEMAQVLKEQTEKISFAYRWDCVTEVLKDACKGVCEASNYDMRKVFFVCGGSEATEISIKLARRYFLNQGKDSKYKVIARHQSYHGSSMGALSITGFPGRQAGYQDYLFEQGHIPPAYCYRCWYDKDCQNCNFECAKALEEEIMKQGPETVAAFIMEPVSGMAICGAHAKNGYYAKIREICDRYDVLLIDDEVMCGMGRTGSLYAYQSLGFTPDIVAMGKALAGGYFPIGAVACSQKVYDAIDANSGEFPPGYSWAGNPLGSAVVCKTLEILKKENLVEKVAKKGRYLKDKLSKMAEKHWMVGDVRGRGLMVGLEFVIDKNTKESFDSSLKIASRISTAALQQGMFLEVSTGCNHGRCGDMAMVAPAYIVTYEEIDLIVDKVDKAIGVVEEKCKRLIV